ncbi:hypothetical protein B296_00009306 [Ensete ventricosum]|uniref:Uncharacterized protein n=1 Tax=Ensete ventricosum TaxID=4639 RepID=A0A427AZT0_ENSVE|nr:hypothetical protein B296_00009306 [Ensete ventricosum]
MREKNRPRARTARGQRQRTGEDGTWAATVHGRGRHGERRFEELLLRCEIKEDQIITIQRFVNGLRFDIQREAEQGKEWFPAPIPYHPSSPPHSLFRRGGSEDGDSPFGVRNLWVLCDFAPKLLDRYLADHSPRLSNQDGNIILQCKVCNTKWYHPYQEVRTDPPIDRYMNPHYRAVPPIGVVSAPLPPAEEQYHAAAREKEEEGEEKGEPGDPVQLSLNDPDPLPPSLAGRCR